ncbi:MAG: MFS transporter [Halobacteriales archaeon]
MTDARRRWLLVAGAALAMGVAGTYQFAWSSIRVALGGRIGAPEAALGTVFTVFVVLQTLSQFPAGWVRDRYGPGLPLAVAAPLLAVGYAGVALASDPLGAALAYAVGGVGAGTAYTVAVNTPVKWFDERRGLATGVVTMAYGGLSFLLIPALRRGTARDFPGTLLALGALTGVAVLAVGVALRDPEDGDDAHGGSGSGTTHTWRETIRTWQFWLLYGIFVVVNGVGLMLIGKVVALAEALGLPGGAATAGASFLALGEAGGLIVVGHLSDRLGRERTLAASLVVAGIATAGLVAAGEAGLRLAFVVAVAAAAFFRSPAFVVVPSLVGSYYGVAHSSENYAALYTAKLWGGVFGGAVASSLVVALGWGRTFLLGGALLAVAGLATLLLRPVEG